MIMIALIYRLKFLTSTPFFHLADVTPGVTSCYDCVTYRYKLNQSHVTCNGGKTLYT